MNGHQTIDPEFLKAIAPTIRTFVHSYNFTEQLPAELALCTRLTKLDVSHNKLETVPDALGYLTNLKILVLHANKLSAIPNTISRCMCHCSAAH